jgi:hypothetical protein
MSVVNQKGAFFKTIEINRDTVAKSVTTLIEPILKQAKNYVAQVQRFVTNISPQINTFTTPMLTILGKPVHDQIGIIDDIEEAELEYGDELVEPVAFTPSNIHSITELARQIDEFCRGYGGVSFTLNADFTFDLKLNKAFGNNQYIKVQSDYAKLVGLPEYLFYFRARVPSDPDDANNGENTLVTTNNELWLNLSELDELQDETENFHFRPAIPFLDADPESVRFTSSNSLYNCDTRQFLDVTFSMPHIAQVCILNGTESQKKLLARFPLKDFLETEHVFFNDYDTYGAREVINLGLEDLCRGNPASHSMLLLPGDVQHANVLIESTYLQWDPVKLKHAFVSIPTDFGIHGFWSLKLILAKKIK